MRLNIVIRLMLFLWFIGGSTTTKSPPQRFSPPRLSPPNNQRYEGFKNHTGSGKGSPINVNEEAVKADIDESTIIQFI